MRLNWTRRLGLAAGALAVAAALAGPAHAQPIVGLTKSPTNGIFTFDSAIPGTVSATTPVTGLNPGDTLLAIDRNPNDGQLYALGSQSRMYSLNEATGVATQVGPVFTNLLGSLNVDMDFDPQFGVIRITTDGDKNIIWFTSGFDQLDTALTWAPAPDPNAGTDPVAVGLAYTPNVPQASSPTAFAYQYAPTDIIATLGSAGGSPDSPSGGVLHTVGPPGVVAGATSVGLDAGPDGTMFALLRTDGAGAEPVATRLYTIDTATGTATLVSGADATSVVGTGADTTADIATEAVTNNFQLSANTYPVSESAGTVTVTVTRSQSRGVANVQIASSDGSAVSGRDYTGIGTTLFFADGQASKTQDIPIRSDVLDESSETFNLALSTPIGGHAATVAPSSAVVVIEDDDTGPPPSDKITALTTTNELVTFDSATPGTVSAPLAVTGLVAGEELVAIDRRPATGQLYGMTKQSRLYTIDEASGAATQVGTGQFSPSLAGSAWGFDFDPVADTIRVTANQNGQNLRLNPTTGVSTADSPLVYDASDPNAAFTPVITAIAYTDNVPGATSTTLFAYEFQRDSLARVGSPGGAPIPVSSGASVTIGKSGLSASPAQNTGMDIGTDGIAWALLRDNNMSRLNIMDLTTGRAALVGEVGAGADIYRDITLPGVSQVVQLSADSYGGSEAAGKATVTVTRSQTLGAATLDYATSNGSATAGSDYTAATGTVAFAAGEASKEISIPVTNDAAVEGPETLTLAVSNARGGVASIGSPSTATVTIADDGTVMLPDTTKPVVTTCHKSKQNVVKQRAVIVCVKSNEDGSAKATGKLTIAGVKKPFPLRKAGRAVIKGAKRTLKLKLSKKALAALKKALRKGKTATAKVTIKVRDKAGNETRLTRKIRARSPTK